MYLDLAKQQVMFCQTRNWFNINNFLDVPEDYRPNKAKNDNWKKCLTKLMGFKQIGLICAVQLMGNLSVFDYHGQE